MKTPVTVELDGKKQDVLAEIVDRKLWFKTGQGIFSYDLTELSPGTQRKTKGSAKSADKITAPMPGRVTKVFVSEKQSVKKGDALLVMEAMKMEYTLKADLAGDVEKIFVKVSDQVPLGHLMIQLKEVKGQP